MRWFTVVFWQEGAPKFVQYLYDNFEDADECASFLMKSAREGSSYQVAELTTPEESFK